MTEGTPEHAGQTGITRRQALIGGGAALGALALGGLAVGRSMSDGSLAPADVLLRPSASTVELGSRAAKTWTFNGRLPGPEIRIPQGTPVTIRVQNDLPADTAVHWHGIRVANAADGVPGLTQDPISPGESLDYAFTPPDAGTYLYHSHVGTQLDRGLYGALIVEPANEPGGYDQDVVLMLDDWLDGIAGTPDQQLRRLRDSGMDMGSMSEGTQAMGGMGSAGDRSMPGRHTRLDGGTPGASHLAQLANLMERGAVDSGDVRYPLYLINGRPPEDPFKVVVGRGDQVRVRIINPSADTIFCFFVENHPLTITHADGQPVTPVATDGLVIGMGERYDVLLDATAGGAQRMMAMPLGKAGRAVGTLRYADSAASAPRASAAFRAPKRIASYSDLRGVEAPDISDHAVETFFDLGFAAPYTWTVGAKPFRQSDLVRLGRGQPHRFVIRNATNMPHPMHLHGHSFRVAGSTLVKDTVLVAPRQRLVIDFRADNPGAWAFHCHNAYHQEVGMMRRIEVS